MGRGNWQRLRGPGPLTGDQFSASSSFLPCAPGLGLAVTMARTTIRIRAGRTIHSNIPHSSLAVPHPFRGSNRCELTLPASSSAGGHSFGAGERSKMGVPLLQSPFSFQ